MVALFRGHWCFLIKEKEKMRFKSSLWQSGMAFAMVQKFLGVGMETAESVREAWVYCGNKVFSHLDELHKCRESLHLQVEKVESSDIRCRAGISKPDTCRRSVSPFTSMLALVFQELIPAIVCQPNSNVRFLFFPEMEFVIEHYWDLICTVFNM